MLCLTVKLRYNYCVISDTDPKIQKVIYDRLQKLTETERLDKLLQLISTGRALMVSCIKKDFPNATEEKVQEQMAIRIFGNELGLKFIRSKINK